MQTYFYYSCFSLSFMAEISFLRFSTSLLLKANEIPKLVTENAHKNFIHYSMHTHALKQVFVYEHTYIHFCIAILIDTQ